MASSAILTNHLTSFHPNLTHFDGSASGADMTTALPMQSRKFSTNFNNMPVAPFNQYVTSSTHHDQEKSTSPVDMYRPTTDYRENQQMGHFTFNQSITHVNLINPRFPMNMPPSSHGYPQAPFNPENSMNLSSSHTNMFFKPDHRNIYNEASSYNPPPQLPNNTSSIADTENIYTLTHQGYNYKDENMSDTDFKFNLPLNPLELSNSIHNGRQKQEMNNLYGNNGVTGSMNNNVFHTNFPTPIEKVANMFLSNAANKNKDQDIDQVDDTQKCKNTIEGTKTSVRRFKKWYKERYNKELDMNCVNKFNAPELLKDFFMDIRDTRPGRVGNEYEPVTLTTYRNGLRRFFLYRKVPPGPDNFDLTDKSFDLVNRHLVNKRDDLKRSGKGNHPNAVESITPEQLEKMWASGAIGTHSPRALLRLMWWYNTVYHGVRGRMAHHDLSTEDFLVQRALDGKLIMEYTKNKPLLNISSSGDESKLEPKKKKFKGMARETDGGERDPIRAFEIFKSHRPAGISSFYLTPKHKPKGQVWFNKVPMGKNSIGRIMREIKAIANI